MVHLYKCPVYVSSFSPTPDLSALHSYMKLSGNTTLPTCAADGLPKYSNWHWQQTWENRNETFNFSCCFFFLRFSMSPFDLICSFGLVMAKQLIQQTCLMRCEACTQIQLSYPLPTFLLSSPAYWR